MGRHAARRGAGRLAWAATAAAVLAATAGVAVVRMSGGGPAQNAATSVAETGVTATADPSASAQASADPSADPSAAAPEPPPVTAADSAVPRAAVALGGADSASTRVVVGSLTRTVPGMHPVRWFADGTLLLEAPDESVTGVYDPAAGRFVARIGYTYGRRGLPPESGPGAAPLSFFIPEDLIAGPREPLDKAAPARDRPAHDRTLIEVSHRLVQHRTQLPDGKPAGESRRSYRPSSAVRVGDAVFVPYTQTRRTATGWEAAGDGVLRVRGGHTSTLLRGRHVQRLAVSADGAHLLAVTRVPAPGGRPAAGADPAGLRILSVDPGTGKVRRNLALPRPYGTHGVRLGRLDRAGSRFAVELARACGACAGDAPSAVWQWRGGTWSEVPGTRRQDVVWQEQGAALAWRAGGPITLVRDGRREEVLGGPYRAVVAPGSLLEP